MPIAVIIVARGRERRAGDLPFEKAKGADPQTPGTGGVTDDGLVPGVSGIAAEHGGDGKGNLPRGIPRLVKSGVTEAAYATQGGDICAGQTEECQSLGIGY